MSTTYGVSGLGQTVTPARRSSNLVGRFWDAFQERRQRRRLQAALYGLSDRELMDIGTTRGEIDYLSSNRSIDPRRTQSSKWTSAVWR
jgi:uncharacterized protein YjiS (DUF1127 family)